MILYRGFKFMKNLDLYCIKRDMFIEFWEEKKRKRGDLHSLQVGLLELNDLNA